MKRTSPHNRWHSTMYDYTQAIETLGTKSAAKLAKQEAALLISELNLKRGQAILDVPCGTGRHSAVFASRGIHATGIDINEDCLKIAKARFKHIHFKTGDMSKLKQYRGQFDAVVNLFSSFGYFSTDKENEAVLKELVACLKPGGRIAIHIIDRDWLMKVFRPAEWTENNGMLTLDARRYDNKTHYIEAQRIVVNRKTQQAKTYYHRMRLYSKTEVFALFKRCGLTKIRVIGDRFGNPYKKETSTHPFYIGEVPITP